MKTNAKGQVIEQLCTHCARASEICAGRCSRCGNGVEWKSDEGLYKCRCGISVFQVTPNFDNDSAPGGIMIVTDPKEGE